MVSAKGVESPDVKKSADQQALETRSPLLPKEAASEFRSAVMRAAYLSQDRPDIGHAVKNLARRLVQPTEASLTDLKRLIRYLIRYLDFAQVFKAQKAPERLAVQVDSDHAGDTVTRKSTTGMIAYYVQHSSNVQPTIVRFRQVSQSIMLWLKVEVPGWEFSPYWLTMVCSCHHRVRLERCKGYSQPCWTWQSTPYPNPILVAAGKSSRKPP